MKTKIYSFKVISTYINKSYQNIQRKLYIEYVQDKPKRIVWH